MFFFLEIKTLAFVENFFHIASFEKQQKTFILIENPQRIFIIVNTSPESKKDVFKWLARHQPI